MLQLTRSNYHSLEAERDYMSRSQYLGFLKCEACQMAKLAGDWIEEKSEAFLVGSYVHAWNEGRRREFIAENPGMFTRKGTLRANFQTADKMIACLESDPLAMYMLEGEKEVCFTAEFAGAVWKVLADTYNPDRRRMVELKTTRSIREQQWSVECGSKVTFIEQYNYLLQAALYCEIERLAAGRPEGDWLDYYMVAVSKDNCPDKEVIDLRDPDRYLVELDRVKANMPRILLVKSGRAEPTRCERCDYCRSTRVLSKAVHYTELASWEGGYYASN
jgi:hypothetical protein